MRRITVTIVVLAATCASCGSRQVATTVPAPDDRARPGALVDWRLSGRMPVPGHPTVLADVYRYSYVTESDRRQVATGRVAIPRAALTEYDVVAHLHGTIGFADHCAPSAMPGFGFESPLNPIPADMVAAGRVVVMPDYPGLGGPGRHRYVEREATGRSVWDALAAAKILVPTVRPNASVSDRVMLMGHSQGGHATLAALSTKRESDHFEVVGAVAFAPPGDAVRHAQLVARGDARPAPLAWGLMSYAHAYPTTVVPDRWFEERVADTLPGLMDRRCVVALNVWLGFDAERIFTEDALHTFHSGDLGEEMREVLAREQFVELRTSAPIRIYHGTNDGLLPAELSRELAGRLKENGNDVEWYPVEGAGHLIVPRRTRSDVVAWIDERFHAAH